MSKEVQRITENASCEEGKHYIIVQPSEEIHVFLRTASEHIFIANFSVYDVYIRPETDERFFNESENYVLQQKQTARFIYDLESKMWFVVH